MEKLNINSAPFDTLRVQFDDMLQSTIKQIGGSDNAEITIKLKLAKDYAGDNADELQLSWDITKTIKAKKYKISGRPQDNPIINIEEDGHIVVYEIRQLSLLDDESADDIL
jgi:hypothetical protein